MSSQEAWQMDGLFLPQQESGVMICMYGIADYLHDFRWVSVVRVLHIDVQNQPLGLTCIVTLRNLRDPKGRAGMNLEKLGATPVFLPNIQNVSISPWVDHLFQLICLKYG